MLLNFVCFATRSTGETVVCLPLPTAMAVERRMSMLGTTSSSGSAVMYLLRPDKEKMQLALYKVSL